MAKTPSLKAIEQQNHTTTTSSKDFFNTLSQKQTWHDSEGVRYPSQKQTGMMTLKAPNWLLPRWLPVKRLMIG
ncbi:MAG: hypothetical protein R3186_10820, partial [Ruegeria sp.]|nr:hypothetical protein [Ruegeria sp.]